MEDVMRWRPAIHILRLVASFCLLGAVLAGIVFGWVDHWIDFRVIGALVGAVVGIVVAITVHRSGIYRNGDRHNHWPA
jgi:hypothetical protein